MKKTFLFLICLMISFNLPADDFPLPFQPTTYDDGFSTISAMVVNNTLEAEFTIREEAPYPFCGIPLPCRGNFRDLSKYSGIRLQAKGSSDITLSLVTGKTQSRGNHYSTILELTDQWQTFEIPFDLFMQLWGTPSPFEAGHAINVNFQRSGKWLENGSFAVRQIEFLEETELGPPSVQIPSFNEPQLNQLGFRPESAKHFSIKQNGLQPGMFFYLIDIESGETVFTGILGEAIDDRKSTGEIVLQGDFSEYRQEGQYIIKVEESASVPFQINANVYLDLYQAALDCYRLLRCGTAVDDPETGIAHGPCHTEDIRSEEVVGIERDFTGGWHNAGDFGKWTHITAISVNHMLLLLEWEQEGIIRNEGANEELVDEIRWGLDFLLKMQNDDGGVFHKVDTDPYFAQGAGPDEDPYERFARYGARGETQPSTIDVAGFTAVMFQAARVFAETDPEASGKYREAALKSLQWLNSHSPRGQNDPWYTDGDPNQELLWAYGEAYRETGEERYLRQFKRLSRLVQLSFPGWMDPQMLGYYTLLNSQVLEQADRERFLNRMIQVADDYLAISRTSGYGPALQSADYHWGSNQKAAGRGTALILTYLLTGEEGYLQGAQSQLDYLLGRNSLNQSFVPGFGSRPGRNPYHWAEMAYGIALPGWLTGGPNQYVGQMSMPDFHRRILVNSGAPPAKCFADKADLNGSWSSNEGALDHQASWLLLTGFLANSE